MTGNIAVYDETGTVQQGYVSRIYDGQNSYTKTTNAANALVVQIDTAASAPFGLVALNPPQSRPLVGAVGGSGGYYFGPGSLGYAYLSGTGFTPAGSTPSFSAGHDIQSLNYNAPAESTIWSLSGSVLNAQWINSDGTSNPTKTFYDPNVDFLGLVGDFAKFNATFPSENAALVTLVFTGPVPEPASLAFAGVALSFGLLRRQRRQI